MTQWRKSTWVTTVALVLTALATPAAATSDHDATAHAHYLVQQRAERGLLIGKRTFWAGLDVLSSSGAREGITFTAPLRLGVHKKVDIFANAQLRNGDPDLFDPGLGVTYRFRDGLLEMAMEGSLRMAVLGPVKHIGANVGMPMRMHFRENLSLDASPTLTVLLRPDADWFLSLPLAGNFNLTDAIAITGGTSFTLEGGNAGASGLVIGGSWTGASNGKPWLEVGGKASWGRLNNQGLVQMIVFVRYYGWLRPRRG